jgi:hypothetical protein
MHPYTARRPSTPRRERRARTAAAVAAVGLVVLGALIGACSSDEATSASDLDAGGSDATASSDSARDASGDGMLADAVSLDGSLADAADARPSDDGATIDASDAAIATPIYAHTGTELYEIDPVDPTLAPVDIGAFDCIGGGNQDDAMTDIAVDHTGAIWGVSVHDIYQVDATTAHCTAVSLGANAESLFGLTFAPVGVLDPNVEVLVGANTAGELWAVTSNGTLTQHGTFGVVPANDGHGHGYPATTVGKSWELSGDIVFVANGGSPAGFATVRDCPSPPSTVGCDTTDTLIEIDITAISAAGTADVTKAIRGLVVKSAGCSDAVSTGYGSLFGIAAWGGDILGFGHAGATVRVSSTDGTACLVASGAALWAGAGVTTLAPIVPPPL